MSPHLRCHQCGYVWEYTGSLRKATCSNCSAKVSVDQHSLDEPLEVLADEYDLTVEELRELLKRAETDDP